MELNDLLIYSLKSLIYCTLTIILIIHFDPIEIIEILPRVKEKKEKIQIFYFFKFRFQKSAACRFPCICFIKVQKCSQVEK